MSDCQGSNENGVNIDLYNNGFINVSLSLKEKDVIIKYYIVY